MSGQDVGNGGPSDAALSPTPSSSHGLDATTELADAEVAQIQMGPNVPNPCCHAMQQNLFRAIRSTADLAKRIQHCEAIEQTNSQMALQMAEQSTYIENHIQHQHDLQMSMDKAIAERNVAVQHEHELERQILMLEQNSATLRKKAEQADSFAAKYQHLVLVAEELQQKRVNMVENSKRLIHVTTDLKAQVARQEQMIAQLKMDKTALTHRLRSCKKYVPMMLKTIDELVPLAGNSLMHYTRKRIDTLAQEDVRLQLMGSRALAETEGEGSDEEMAGDLEDLISSGVKTHWSPKKKTKAIEPTPPTTIDRRLDESDDEMDVPGTSEGTRMTPIMPRSITAMASSHRGRGGRTARRGRGNVHDVHQMDMDHMALLRNKLSRARDADVSGTPTARSSIHGKKGLTVREQQEQQSKEMTVKERVALMRKGTLERIPIEATHRLEDSFRMPLSSKTPLVLPPASPVRTPQRADLFSELQMSPSPVKSKTSASRASADVPPVEEHREQVTFSLNGASDSCDDYDMNAYSTMDQLDFLTGDDSSHPHDTPSVEVNPLAPGVSVADVNHSNESLEKKEQIVVEAVAEEAVEEQKATDEENGVIEEVEAVSQQSAAPVSVSVVIPPVEESTPSLIEAPALESIKPPTEASIAEPLKSSVVSVAPVAPPSPRLSVKTSVESVKLAKASIVPSPSLPHLEAEWPSSATIRALEVMEMIASELEPPLTPIQMRQPFVSEPVEQPFKLPSNGQGAAEKDEPLGAETNEPSLVLSPVMKIPELAERTSEAPVVSQVNRAPAGASTAKPSPFVSPLRKSSRVCKKTDRAAQCLDAEPKQQPSVSQENLPTPVARSRQTRVKQPGVTTPTVAVPPRKRRLSSTSSKALPDAAPPIPKAKETPRNRPVSRLEDKPSPVEKTTPPPMIIPQRAMSLPRKPPVRPALVAAEPIGRRTARTAVAAPRVSRVAGSEATSPATVAEKPVSRRTSRSSDSANFDAEKEAVPEASVRRVAHRTVSEKKPSEEVNKTSDDVPEDAESPYVPQPVSVRVSRSLSLPTKRAVDPRAIQRIIITDDSEDESLVVDQGPEEVQETEEKDTPSNETEKKDVGGETPKQNEAEVDGESRARVEIRPVVKKAMSLGSLRNSLSRGAPTAAQMNNLKNAIAKRLKQGNTAAVAPKATAKEKVIVPPKAVSVAAKAVKKETTAQIQRALSQPTKTARKTAKPAPVSAEVTRKTVRGAVKRVAETAQIPTKRPCLTKNTAEGLLEKALDMDCDYDNIRTKMSEEELAMIRGLPADTFGRIMAEVAIRRPTGNMFHSVIASYRKKDISNVHNKSEETLMHTSFALCADQQNVFAPFIQGLLTHLVSHATADPTICHKIVRLVILAVQAEEQQTFDSPIVFGSNPMQIMSTMMEMIAYEHPILLGEALIYLLLQAPANFVPFLTEEESEPLRRIVVLYSEKIVCEIVCWFWEVKFSAVTRKRLTLPKASEELSVWLEELALSKDDLFIEDGQTKLSESAVTALRMRPIYALTKEGVRFVDDEIAAAEVILKEMIQHYDLGEKQKLEGMGDLFTDNVRKTQVGDVSFESAHRLALLLKTLCSYGLRLFDAKEMIGPVKTRKIIDGIGSCCESTRLLNKFLQDNPPRSPQLGVLLSGAFSEFLDEFRVLSQHPF